MNWLKELSLILVIASLAILTTEAEKKVEETSGRFNEQQLKFLVNPLDILNAKKPTSTPKPAVVRPVYAYPYPYPSHYYPNYATPATTARPKRPKPSKQYSYPYYPYPNQGFGYYPLYIAPTTPQHEASPDQHDQQPPILLVYDLDPKHHGNKYAHWDKDFFGHGGRLLTDNVFPVSNEQLEDDQTGFQDHENDDETDGHHADLSGVSLTNESEEDGDTIAINTDHIKLPFDIQLSSHKNSAAENSNKRLKHQEALIYLRNFKKGRKLH